MSILLYVTVTFTFLSCSFAQKEKAIQFLKNYEDKFVPLWRDEYKARWKLATNITKYNAMRQNEAIQMLDEQETKWRELAAKINTTDSDKYIKRQFKMLLNAITFRDKNNLKKSTEVHTAMRSAYNTGSIPYNSTVIKSISVNDGVEELRLGKHLTHIMASSNNTEELLYVWKSWRDIIGSKVKGYFTEYVRLRNIGAKESGFKDAGEHRRASYEVNDLEGIAEDFLNDMRPFYLELHGYVRYRLSKVYPDLVKEGGYIPAHLLGNMWAQNWANIYPYVTPYPGEPTLDVTPVIKNKLSTNEMFKMAEGFFTSIGWRKLPAKFWTHSLFEEPKNRKVECHASAWDFTMEDNGEPDVRVKMCTRKTQAHFTTIHHELGHSYYQMFYWNQPLLYRTGANPGFHEAVGDTMVLSVQTPAHLKKVGLLKEVSETPESDINFLLKTALRRIAFLPFAFLMDKWVWDVYSGDITPDKYNAKWWEYRMKYQGIKSPVERDDDGFDAGGKSHITRDTPYIRYFFSYILQFAFHKQACKLAKHVGPLHQCSIYKSKEAGKALGDMLALGKSKPWPEALKQFTGSEKISTEPIKSYFTPLIVWLRKYRKEEKYTLGWGQ